MQAVYSLWDYVPLKKYRTYGIFPHFFVHEYAAIVSTSKKNTEHTVHVHKIPYIRYFLTFFLCTSMLELCPSQRKIPNIRYMSIIVWIIAPTPVHIRTADCVHLGKNAVHTVHFNLCLNSASTMQAVYSLWELCLSQKIPNTRYFPTMVWVIAPTPICCNCVHLKKYRAYGSHVHTCFDNRTSTIYILQIESISKIPYIRCISINVWSLFRIVPCFVVPKPYAANCLPLTSVIVEVTCGHVVWACDSSSLL